MHNLFIVNTPLQLLTAYILANTVESGNKNQLLLVHPNGYDSWGDSYCLTHMSTDSTTWNQIAVFKRWINRDTKFSAFKSQINQMQETLLRNGEVDRVYLCSDKIIQNQLLVELSGNNSYIRFDEGFGSYFSHDRHLASKIWQYIRIQFFRLLGNMNCDMRYNLGGLGQGKAATADYFYKPHLLERWSPNAIEIQKRDVHTTMAKLTVNMPPYEMLDDGESLLFLGSDFVERDVYSANHEIEILKKLTAMASKKGLNFIYKPHSSEKAAKLEYYQQQIPALKLFYAVEPIEAIYYRQDKVNAVLSFGSSGLLYTDIFAKHKIKSLCVSRIYQVGDQGTDLERIMAKAGVYIPENIEEIADAL